MSELFNTGTMLGKISFEYSSDRARRALLESYPGSSVLIEVSVGDDLASPESVMRLRFNMTSQSAITLIDRLRKASSDKKKAYVVIYYTEVPNGSSGPAQIEKLTAFLPTPTIAWLLKSLVDLEKIMRNLKEPDPARNILIRNIRDLMIGVLQTYTSSCNTQSFEGDLADENEAADCFPIDQADIESVCSSILDFAESCPIDAIRSSLAMYVSGCEKSRLYVVPSRGSSNKWTFSFTGGSSQDRISMFPSPLLSPNLSGKIKNRMLEFAMKTLYSAEVREGGTIAIPDLPTPSIISSFDDQWWNSDGLCTVKNENDDSCNNREIWQDYIYQDRGSIDWVRCQMAGTYLRMMSLGIAYGKGSESFFPSDRVQNPNRLLCGTRAWNSEFVRTGLAEKPDLIADSTRMNDHSAMVYDPNKLSIENLGSGGNGMTEMIDSLSDDYGIMTNYLKYWATTADKDESNELLGLYSDMGNCLEFMRFAKETIRNEAFRISFIVHFMPWFYLIRIIGSKDLLAYLFDEATGGIPEMRNFAFNEIIAQLILNKERLVGGCLTSIIGKALHQSTDLPADSKELSPIPSLDALFDFVSDGIEGFVKGDGSAMRFARAVLTSADSLPENDYYAKIRCRMVGLVFDHYDLFDPYVDGFFGIPALKGEPRDIRRIAFIEYAMPKTFSMAVTARFDHYVLGLKETDPRQEGKPLVNEWLTDYSGKKDVMTRNGHGKPFSAEYYYANDFANGKVYSGVIDFSERQSSDVYFYLKQMTSSLLMSYSLYMSLLEGLLSLETMIATNRYSVLNSSSSYDAAKATLPMSHDWRRQLLVSVRAPALVRELARKLSDACFKSKKRFFYRIIVAMKKLGFECNTNIVRSPGVKPQGSPDSTDDGMRILMASSFIQAVSESYLSKDAKIYLLEPCDMITINSLTEYTITNDDLKDIANLESAMSDGLVSMIGARKRSEKDKEEDTQEYFLGLGLVSAMEAVTSVKDCPNEVTDEFLMRYLKNGTGA